MSDLTLVLEGSTYAGSVALLAGATIVAERTLVDTGIPSRAGREERVLPSVAECFAEAGVEIREIARVVCGAGPGSFTSLRVSASVAKGIAVGTGRPMYSVSSLILSVASAPQALPAGMYLSVLPAMREEFFVVLSDVSNSGAVTQIGEPFITDHSGLADAAAHHEARLLGPEQQVGSRPHARGVARLLAQIVAAGPVEIDSWEPDYGRMAEAQVRWEAAHGRPLGALGAGA
jgi:tRNA threonylcarbamoyladenosine biosynthesis protein TsaB